MDYSQVLEIEYAKSVEQKRLETPDIEFGQRKVEAPAKDHQPPGGKAKKQRRPSGLCHASIYHQLKYMVSNHRSEGAISVCNGPPLDEATASTWIKMVADYGNKLLLRAKAMAEIAGDTKISTRSINLAEQSIRLGDSFLDNLGGRQTRPPLNGGMLGMRL